MHPGYKKTLNMKIIFKNLLSTDMQVHVKNL